MAKLLFLALGVAALTSLALIKFLPTISDSSGQVAGESTSTDLSSLPTLVPTPSDLPSPTFEPTLTPTDSPVPSPTPFPAPVTPSPSPRPTPTPVPTSVPTSTPSPIPTLSPTSPPSPTLTPTPTSAPTPSPQFTSAQINGLIGSYSAQYSVDPNVVRAIAQCESGFNPQAVNGDYAGLFQYSTATWTSYRGQMSKDTNPTLRFNADVATETTCYVLSHGGSGNWPNCYPH